MVETAEDALHFFWDLFLRYAYLITVLIVYIASLNEVTVFNAAYLMILIVFLGFPMLREKYWVWLLLYCTAVILVNYLWGFSAVSVSNATVESLLGLDPDIFSDVWHDLRWHIAILGLALVQLLAYRLLPSTRVAHHHNDDDGSGDGAHTHAQAYALADSSGVIAASEPAKHPRSLAWHAGTGGAAREMETPLLQHTHGDLGATTAHSKTKTQQWARVGVV